MTRKIALLFALLISFSLTASFAQDKSNLKIAAKPTDMWEFGIHLGHSIITGDVDWKSNIGAGIHLRKALDYTFSVRADLAYYGYTGEEDETVRPEDGRNWGFGNNWLPEYKTSAIGGNVDMVASLNMFKIGKKNKVNPYVFLGGGLEALNITAIDGSNEFDVDEASIYDDNFGISPFIDAGFGIGFMAGKKMSISLEHKVLKPMGRGSDLMDAAALASGFTLDNDLQQYTNVRLGFFLGKTEDKSLPLYWASPLDDLTDDLAEVKARPKLDLTDSDGDGIIDMLDQEKNSPAGAAVDTRGVALDSDGDGVADYQDKEPYSPPGYKVDDQGVAQVPAPDYVTEDDVNRIVDGRIKDIKASTPAPRPVEWFLPMINFGNNSYRIRQSEFGKLHNIATAMKQNPGMRVVATGHTDKTSGNCYNDKLSYNRAQAAVDYITAKYGIPRERFILNWSGENSNLVPTNGSNLMNRRVEFGVASTETEMGAPDCGGGRAGSGGKNYSGNKEAGY